MYARVLRLRHIAPSALWCFVFFEGALAAAVLVALTELVTWWVVPLLPALIAVMVKLNDVVAGAGRRDRDRETEDLDPGD